MCHGSLWPWFCNPLWPCSLASWGVEVNCRTQLSICFHVNDTLPVSCHPVLHGSSCQVHSPILQTPCSLIKSSFQALSESFTYTTTTTTTTTSYLFDKWLKLMYASHFYTVHWTCEQKNTIIMLIDAVLHEHGTGILCCIALSFPLRTRKTWYASIDSPHHLIEADLCLSRDINQRIIWLFDHGDLM